MVLLTPILIGAKTKATLIKPLRELYQSERMVATRESASDSTLAVRK